MGEGGGERRGGRREGREKGRREERGSGERGEERGIKRMMRVGGMRQGGQGYRERGHMNPCQRDQSPQYVSLMSGVCRPLEGSAGCTCTTSSPTQCKERVIVGMQTHPINPLHTLVDNNTMACQISHVGMSGCAVELGPVT